MERKLTGKQIAGNLLLFVGLIAITFYFLLRGQNSRELWQAVRGARVSFIAIAIGCMCVFLLCEGIATWQCLRLFGCRNKLSRNIFYALVGFFFSSVTPSASGGQPMQLYYMHRDTIAVPTATLALLVQFSVFQCVTIAFAAVGFGTQYAQLVQEGGAFRYAFLIKRSNRFSSSCQSNWSCIIAVRSICVKIRIFCAGLSGLPLCRPLHFTRFRAGLPWHCIRQWCVRFLPLRRWKRFCMSVFLLCRYPAPSVPVKVLFCCCFVPLFRVQHCTTRCCSAAASAFTCLLQEAGARLLCIICLSGQNRPESKYHDNSPSPNAGEGLFGVLKFYMQNAV